MENRKIEDSALCFEVSRVLRELADKIDKGEAGNDAHETFNFDGTRVIATYFHLDDALRWGMTAERK